MGLRDAQYEHAGGYKMSEPGATPLHPKAHGVRERWRGGRDEVLGVGGGEIFEGERESDRSNYKCVTFTSASVRKRPAAAFCPPFGVVYTQHTKIHSTHLNSMQYMHAALRHTKCALKKHTQ